MLVGFDDKLDFRRLVTVFFEVIIDADIGPVPSEYVLELNEYFLNHLTCLVFQC